MFIGKICVAFDRIGADANHVSVFRYLGVVVANSASFFGASRGVILGVEVEKQPLTSEFICVVELASLVFSRKWRGGISWF